MGIFTAIGLATGATLFGSAALGGAALVAGAGAIGYSINQADRAASAQRAAAAEQRRFQEQQVTRQRRQSIRANLVRRKQMRAQAQALGAGGSSALAGGISSMTSQLGSNLGFGSMMSGITQNISAFQQQAADFTGQSQLFGQIGQMLLGAPTFGATASAPTPTASAPVYNQRNFSRARSGVNLAGGF